MLSWTFPPWSSTSCQRSDQQSEEDSVPGKGHARACSAENEFHVVRERPPERLLLYAMQDVGSAVGDT